MYLEINDFTWNENEKEVIILVPTKGLDPRKGDILIEENYLKVSLKPFLFECFLLHEVNIADSRVIISVGFLEFHLIKNVPGLRWGELQISHLDKETKIAIKTAAVDRYAARCLEEQKRKEENSRENSSFTLKEMMRLDEEERKRIENVKQNERSQVMEEVEKWRQGKETLVKQARMEFASKSIIPQLQQQQSSPTVTEAEKIFDTPAEKVNDSTTTAKIRAPVREKNTISITFTPRVFPTPERESAKEKEEEWLRQQRERRQLKLDNGETPDMNKQNDPVWLRDKGNAFFQMGDYESAIAAYSHAIDLQSDLHSLYSNRAACHIKVRNFFKAIEDATKTLELLHPPVPQNQKARVLAHLRRGAAFCQLESYKEGLLDYEAAHKIDPTNQKVHDELQKIKIHCVSIE